MGQDTRPDRLVDLGARPHLLPDRRSESPGRRVELAVDLRQWRSQRPSDHAGRTAAEATVGQPRFVLPALSWHMSRYITPWSKICTRAYLFHSVSFGTRLNDLRERK